VRSELTLIQRDLETASYAGESLRSLEQLRQSSTRQFQELAAALDGAHIAAGAEAADLAAAARDWQELDHSLAGLPDIRGELYADTASGSELTPVGRRIKRHVDTILEGQSQRMLGVSGTLGHLAGALRVRVDDSGGELRSLLLGGAAVAGVLLALMLYYGALSRRAAAQAATAQRQVTDILGTVREGLFLVGRDMRIGETHSESLKELLRLPSLGGRSLEALLGPLVDERTMLAATKYLGLLWKDKVHEDLIESVNPLSQIEVSFATARGGQELRYLSFTFRRVRGAEASADYLLGSVSDVTDRVLLARELQQVKSEGESQAALLLELLRADAGMLQTFLASADAAIRKGNAMLTAPGAEQEDLKRKLLGVFRELHGMKGEAAALGLASFAQRVHSAEEILAGLRGRAVLSGNDFLPVVVRLDGLMSHIAHIRSLQERFGRPSPGRQAEEAGFDPSATLPSARTGAVPAMKPLRELFQALARDIAHKHARRVQVQAEGLERVPAAYVRVVKDICVQMIRNAVVHGIEQPERRMQLGKRAEGTLKISFADDAPEDYLLTVEDDGRGLSYEDILERALSLGLITPQQAAALDRTAVYRFIFQSGFSTAAEVSEHAGRGVGLDVVSAMVRECGGRIGLVTTPGQHTRFRIALPKAAAASSAASSAA